MFIDPLISLLLPDLIRWSSALILCDIYSTVGCLIKLFETYLLTNSSEGGGVYSYTWWFCRARNIRSIAVPDCFMCSRSSLQRSSSKCPCGAISKAVSNFQLIVAFCKRSISIMYVIIGLLVKLSK